jgi:hypothetical protein
VHRLNLHLGFDAEPEFQILIVIYLGILETTAEIKELPNFGGHILVAYMHKKLEGNKDVIEIITTTTMDPRYSKAKRVVYKSWLVRNDCQQI